jgi:hypothetical protein
MTWWLQIGGQPRQGRRQGQAAKRPDPLSSGNAMRSSQRPKRKKAATNLIPAYVFPTLSMATDNPINMVAITTVSSAVLLALLAAKHF